MPFLGEGGVILFQAPTTVKVLEIVGLSFRSLMCVQKMRNRSNPYWYRGKEGVKGLAPL